MLSRKNKGRWGEVVARRYLEGKGYSTLLTNYYFRGGEIDLIMQHGHALVLVEVKWRSSLSVGYPEEAVSTRKLRKLWRVGEYLLASAPGCDFLRVEVVSLLYKTDEKCLNVRHRPYLHI